MSDCWWQHLPDDQEVPQELLDELEAQIARHEEATKLAKQREKEAQEAKLRWAHVGVSPKQSKQK
jgi:hypothetical protein